MNVAIVLTSFLLVKIAKISIELKMNTPIIKVTSIIEKYCCVSFFLSQMLCFLFDYEAYLSNRLTLLAVIIFKDKIFYLQLFI